jgi:polyhydroxybutyrate depolymerase
MQRGIVGGYPDGTFKPKTVMTRAELLAIVMKSIEQTEPRSLRCFSDVIARMWYAPYVCRAKERRVISGFPDDTFRPDEPVNVAEGLKILLRAYSVPFDETPRGEWYDQYVDFAHSEGILSRHALLPWAGVTRERMADMVYRMRLREKGELGEGFESAGCGKPPGMAPSSVTVNGEERQFILRVPDGYSHHDAAKIIFAFHGRTNSNDMVRGYMELDRSGPEYFTVYPAALKTAGGTFHWSSPGDKAGELRDFRFFDAILLKLADQYCLDLDEVYVVGHSLGGWFGNAVACARGDIVRGVATLGSSGPGKSECAGPVAAMLIHHPKDALAPFAGGLAARDKFLTQNSCEITETKDVSPRDYNCVSYPGCSNERPVIWCPHEKSQAWDGSTYTHQWPRGTGAEVVRFFEGLR